MKIIARNKKALFDYSTIERFESGVVLKGSEIVTLRTERVNLKDSFVRIIKSGLFLLNTHISHLSTTHSHYKREERAARKLLMHCKQIDKLLSKVSIEGYTSVVLEFYFNHKNKVKATLALAKGENLHGKRESLKKKQADTEARSTMKSYKQGTNMKKKTILLFFIIISFFISACSHQEDIQNDFMFEEYSKDGKIVLDSVNGGAKTLIRTDKGFIVEGEEDEMLMISFFGTFCAPCKEEALELNKLWKNNSNEFIIMGLTYFEDISDETVKKSADDYGTYYFLSNDSQNDRIIA